MTGEEQLRERLGQMLRKHGVPGCAIAARLGDTHLAFDIGSADAAGTRPVDAQTVFHLFSGTKLYTAAALMRLHERGAVDLDQPVSTYLPDLALRHPITARQLASHSSGLPDTLSAFLAVHFFGDPPPTTAAALSRYRTAKGKPPGGKAAYRNVNYAILGELITRVSGMPYPEAVAADVLGPLGSAASFAYDEATRARAAEGTIGRFQPTRWLLRFMSPDVSKRLERERHGGVVPLAEFSLDTAAIGGLIGCAADFLPLAVEMLSNEDGVLSAESKREMLTMQARGQAGIVSAEGVGLGWKLGRANGVELWNHEGGGAGFTSETRIYPRDGVAVVVLMNKTQTRKLSWLAHEMCELLRTA